MTYKAVTNAQLQQIGKMAKEKGIGREDFQQGLDSGVIASALDKLKAKPEISTGLLTEIATVQVLAVEKFLAADHFDPNNPTGIKFYLGSNFKNNFLGKVEENVPAATLAVHRLNRGSVDGPIRKEITPEREETTLAHLYELIKNQPNGKEGRLLTNGYPNIFYIRDANDSLWAVDAYWSSFRRGWDVDAYSVVRPFEWSAGLQVFSQVV